MNSGEVIVLTGFHALGGQADLRQLYSYPERTAPLQPHHLRKKEFFGRPAYQQQVRRHGTKLRKAGDLPQIMRGRYAITAKGSQRLRDAADTLVRSGQVSRWTVRPKNRMKLAEAHFKP